MTNSTTASADEAATSASTESQPSSLLFRLSDDSFKQQGIHDPMVTWVESGIEGEAFYDSFLESLPPQLLFSETYLTARAITTPYETFFFRVELQFAKRADSLLSKLSSNTTLARKIETSRRD
eukprot:IDg2089t1